MLIDKATGFISVDVEVFAYQRQIIDKLLAAHQRGESLIVVPRLPSASKFLRNVAHERECYVLAMANHKRPWAKRWLKAHGYRR